MQRLILSTLAASGFLFAAGCGSNGGGGNNDVMQPLGNSAQSIANQGPNDASLEVTDVDALRQSLIAAFGQPNDESTVIADDQSLADIVN